MPQTSNVRNLLISFGAFWLSLFAVGPLSFLLGELTTRITYGDGLIETVVMGSLDSLGRAVSAILGGLIVLKYADSAKPIRWAFLVSILYVVDAPVRYGRWHIPPTIRDRMWIGANFLFPAIACAVCIAVVDHLRRTHTEPERSDSRFWVLLVASFAVAIALASLSEVAEANTVRAMMRLLVPLSLAWGGLVFAAFRRFKLRGLWLLLGSPLTFYWAYVLALRFLAG